ncbi:heterokaryon incompatibility protein-domain-containing protein [Xylariales sp. PMI_506]|nr:heterokaryon incompatibility protein-domain-containing protein [Xylariales sp. PMI_506]
MPHTLNCRPFSRADAATAAAVTALDSDDISFRYRPNVLCAACRELLDLVLDLYRASDDHLLDEITTNYTFSDVRLSGDLGCHMCATFAVSQEQPGDGIGGLHPLASEFRITFRVINIRRDVSSDVQSQQSPAGLLRLRISLVLEKPRTSPGPGSIGNSVIVYPLAGEQSASRAGELDSQDPLRLSFGQSTGDDETFALAKEWLARCLSQHQSCREHGDDARAVRPTRLLSLDGTIRLIDDAEIEIKENYVTLSHCWGDPSGIPQLRHETEISFRQEIPFAILPKTFQDAVTITRKLGYNYLWIDSLCIIQDSTQDWETQAKKMALYYVNSTFTIAALKSSGSSGGCFTSRRNPLGLRPIHLEDMGGLVVELEQPDSLWESEVNNAGAGASPLHSRAWVVQERLSAPRTLLYGREGIYWECRGAQASERHYRKLTWGNSSNQKTWLEKLVRTTDFGEGGSGGGGGGGGQIQKLGQDPGLPTVAPGVPTRGLRWMDHWARLLKVYTSCKLTKQSDKIIAMTGLISEIERRSSADRRRRCILGLWDHDLSGSMLWYCTRTSPQGLPMDGPGGPRLDNHMPSWTWASVGSPCTYSPLQGRVAWQAGVRVNECSFPAEIKLNTRKRRVWLHDGEISLNPTDGDGDESGKGGDDDESDPFTFGMFPGGEDEEYYYWYVDCEMPGADESLFILLIQRTVITDDPPLWSARCLVARQSAAQPTSHDELPYFQRVGVVFIRYQDAQSDPFVAHDTEEIIKLI